MKVAVLGLGAMGRRMAVKLIDAGHQVTVWTRSQARSTPEGACRAASPAAAAASASLVISMVRDDAASYEVWLGDGGALAALPEDAVGIECSTLSLPFVSELGEAFARVGRAFLDAPLAGSRPQAEAGQLIFFVGGDPRALETARPALEAMGAAVHHAGATGAGALVKLMVNALFGVQLALLGEVIGMARRSGHDPARAVEILGATPVVSPAAKLSAAAMLGDAFPPAFPIDLVEKDFDLLATSAAALGVSVPLGEAARTIYAAAKDEGYGEDNITGIVQRYLE